MKTCAVKTVVGASNPEPFGGTVRGWFQVEPKTAIEFVKRPRDSEKIMVVDLDRLVTSKVLLILCIVSRDPFSGVGHFGGFDVLRSTYIYNMYNTCSCSLLKVSFPD